VGRRPPRERGHGIGQDEGGRDGDEHGQERDHRVGDHPQLLGEQPPGPAAGGDAERQADQQGDGGQGGGLPGQGAADLSPDEPQGLEDGQVAAPPPAGADQRVGQGSDRQQRQQPGEQEGDLGDAGPGW
jgi:hypothetical protein